MPYTSFIITKNCLVLLSFDSASGKYALLGDYNRETSFRRIFARLLLWKILTYLAAEVQYCFFCHSFPWLRLREICLIQALCRRTSFRATCFFSCAPGLYFKRHWICTLLVFNQIIGETLFYVVSLKPVAVWIQCTVNRPKHAIDSGNMQLLNRTVSVVWKLLRNTLFLILTVNQGEPISFVLFGTLDRKRTVLCHSCTVVW